MSANADEPLSQLGRPVAIAASPAEAVLEVVGNAHTDELYIVRFTCPEFTTLCPITGQPDFAHFVIDYLPDRHLIESKSMKLFLASFRNARGFHEDTTLTIAKRTPRKTYGVERVGMIPYPCDGRECGDDGAARFLRDG